MTAQGPRQVADLVDKPATLVHHGAPAPSGARGFFPTGTKPVLRLRTREGYSLRLTADHRVQILTATTRTATATEWRAAGNLRPGDRLALHDHRAAAAWAGAGTENEGYLLGLLLGDGTLKTDKAVLSVWPGEMTADGSFAQPGVLGVMAAAETAARSLRHRSDFTGWIVVPGRAERRLALGALKIIARDFGLAPGAKRVTPEIERASAAFYRGFLRGLFDSDGSLQGTTAKGISLRLAQSDLETLQAVQRMLLRLGMVATLYANRRLAGQALLPDGRGGQRFYPTKAQHELVLSGENLLRFRDLIGLADDAKRAALDRAIASFKRRPNRVRFYAEVATIEADGEAEVFDVQMPGINAFDANGLVAHNCGEQPLPPYGACLLGSINLAALVRQPFADNAALDEDALESLTATAVRMLDNAISVSRFPLPQQEEEARAKRRIGLGITGLADALLMLGLRYGSEEAAAITRRWMGRLRDAAYRASAGLAAEKGAFPLFERARYLAAEMPRRLPDDIRQDIERYGIRNALLTSVAPTGTISLLADNVSSGLEPVFAFHYRRSVLEPDGTRRQEEVSDPAWRLWQAQAKPDAEPPAHFVTAETLTPDEHLAMQAAVQEFVDASVSKTVNLPASFSFEDFKELYRKAFALGLKGCTTYRPSALRGAVLATAAAPVERPAPAGEVVYMSQPLDRPEILPGQTYKLKWPGSDHALYITLNDIEQPTADGGLRRRPFEIFVNSKNMEHYAWTVALTRMISAVFRRGGDVAFVVEELKAVFDPRGGAWLEGRYVPSLLAAIGGVIEKHMVEIGFLAAPAGISRETGAARQVVGLESPPAQCPKCGQAALIHAEGCELCTACGFSTCA
jgi:ribonucleoside-diphosphate reductase alpha chain